MDILESIRQRKSIRDFKDDQVPQSVLREILEVARRAPSAMNIQPWEFIVMANDVLEEINIGAISQNICLAALPFDLGTCIEDQG